MVPYIATLTLRKNEFVRVPFAQKTTHLRCPEGMGKLKSAPSEAFLYVPFFAGFHFLFSFRLNRADGSLALDTKTMVAYVVCKFSRLNGRSPIF